MNSKKLFGSDLQEFIKFWNRFIPYTPAQIYGIISQDYPAPVSVHFFLNKGGICDVRVLSRQLGLIANRFLSLIKEQDHPYLSFIDVEQKKRGLGTAKIWRRNGIEFAVAMGKNDYRFNAGAAYGVIAGHRIHAHLAPNFLNPVSVVDRNNRDLFLKRTEFRLKFLKPDLSEQEYDLIRSMYAFDEKESIGKLIKATEGITLPVSSGHAYKKKRRQYRLKNPYDQFGLDQITIIRRAFNEAASRGISRLPVFNALLRTTYAPSIIDFADLAQMEKVGNSLGGWNTIQPA